MTRTTTRSFAVAAAIAAALAYGCSESKPPGGTGAPETSATAVTPTTSAPSAVVSAAPPPTETAAVTASAPVASASGAPAASGSAAAGPKTYDCGAKGQKACPMQGWMKGVMGSAAANNDAEKLAAALSTAASKPPPGFGNWSSIASAGAAKAKAGDVDGAKQSCKQCHDLYKAKYQKEMRDRPW